MGAEFGQFKEWDNGMGIDFCLFEFEKHKKLNDFVKFINKIYATTPSLYEIDYSWEGFNWIIPDDCNQNVVAFTRKDKIEFNFTKSSTCSTVYHTITNAKEETITLYTYCLDKMDLKKGVTTINFLNYIAQQEISVDEIMKDRETS